jgi:DNA-binding HxlR family transcriptional regulator
MPRKNKANETLCPISRAQDVVGDRWIMLILRELFMDNGRFDDLQIQTKANPQLLAIRLKKLQADGIVERRPYSQRPPRYEYRLTKKGIGLYPVIFALRRWGEDCCKTKDEGVAVRYLHKPCGKDPGLGPTCAYCDAVLERQDLTARLAPAYELERSNRQRAGKKV